MQHIFFSWILQRVTAGWDKPPFAGSVGGWGASHETVDRGCERRTHIGCNCSGRNG
jgi:hypothetical protein